MTTLTTLPITLQSRILKYLYDDPYCDEQRYRFAKLHGSGYYLPLRNRETRVSLDRMRIVNARFPEELLFPALASPALAAAAFRLVNHGMPYLTDANTNGRLAQWVRAFSAYVEAVGVTDVGEMWKNSLPEDMMSGMAEKLCWDTVDLFREITVNHVRLKVLDLVNAPFDSCESVQDALLTGLCSTLETCQSSLKELALPVYLKSDICACALEMATLPHLTVLCIEFNDKRKSEDVLFQEKRHLGRQFLGMMRAVDGHADRVKGLTTLEELRLINLHFVPFYSARKSGCSAGFFRAVKTLRVRMNHYFTDTAFNETIFFCLFSKLERLYWTGLFWNEHDPFQKLTSRVREVHLCHHHWIEGAQVGAKIGNDIRGWEYELGRTVRRIHKKIGTLVWYDGLFSYEIERIWRNCPNLQYLSLYVTKLSARELGRCVRKCEGLKGLEIRIDENALGRLNRDGWMKVGKAIPRDHANLRELAILARMRVVRKATPTDWAIDCLVDAVERMGARLEKLVFRATFHLESIPRTLREVCRVLDTCLKHSPSLESLQVEFPPCSRRPPAFEVLQSTASAREELGWLTRMLVQSRPRLTKLELGLWHHCL